MAVQFSVALPLILILPVMGAGLVESCGEEEPTSPTAAQPTHTASPPGPTQPNTPTDSAAPIATPTSPSTIEGTPTQPQTAAPTDVPTQPPGTAVPLLPLAEGQAVSVGHFATSGVCQDCHSNAPAAQAMRDDAGRPVSPFDLWEATMMANASRDPLWRAVVSAEVDVAPGLSAFIEGECMRCHAPMASYQAERDDEVLTVDLLHEASPMAQLALDGVSCTACHQIQPDGLGTSETFSGRFEIGDDKVIFGPHSDPFAEPMVNRTGFTPAVGDHIKDPGLCGSCHTLFTQAVTADGEVYGDPFPEQSPYLEWRNSDFNTEGAPGPEAATCQVCHMPTYDADGNPIVTAIARKPDGSDFPPIDAREPFGRHLFVGGNTLIPAILRDHADDLSPLASEAALDTVISLATQMLTEHTATLNIGETNREGDVLLVPVTVSNLTGHKLPTAYPSRRMWLRVEVLDGQGQSVFLSGGWDEAGRILAGGAVAAFEGVGGPIEAHHDVISDANEVQIWQSVMGTADGTPTFRLLGSEAYAKDNRLLPRGWSPDHRDAATTRPVGTQGDPTFAAGSDQIIYRIDAPAQAGPYSIRASLAYQTLSARFAAELFTHKTSEVAAFRSYYEAADRAPVIVATDAATSTPGGGQ